MENIKIVNEESYSELSKYIQTFSDYTPIKHPLAYVDENNKKYFIIKSANSEENQVYYIACDDGDGIKLFGANEIKGLFTYWDSEHTYLLSDDTAQRKTADGRFIEQLSVSYPEDNGGRARFEFSQCDVKSPIVLIQLYPILINISELTYLYCLGEKDPLSLIFAHTNRLRRDNYYVYEDGCYFKYKVTKSRKARFSLFPVPYSKYEMQEIIKSRGFNPHVPQDLINLYQGSDRNQKVLKKVMDAYKNKINN